jgi:hypothetical protein
MISSLNNNHALWYHRRLFEARRGYEDHSGEVHVASDGEVEVPIGGTRNMTE